MNQAFNYRNPNNFTSLWSVCRRLFIMSVFPTLLLNLCCFTKLDLAGRFWPIMRICAINYNLFMKLIYKYSINGIKKLGLSCAKLRTSLASICLSWLLECSLRFLPLRKQFFQLSFNYISVELQLEIGLSLAIKFIKICWKMGVGS